MKIRIIPTILTDGFSQVKGSGFDNWRTVGFVRTAVRVHASRDVDELVLLDVKATEEKRTIDPVLVAELSKELRIPLTVGGGIDSVEAFAAVLAAGADKIVIGTAAVENPQIVSELASEFGSQAVVCAVDTVEDSMDFVSTRCGQSKVKRNPVELATQFEELGAGELLVQSVTRDGKMEGMSLDLLDAIIYAVTIPVIGSSGVGSSSDVIAAFSAGCSAVASGAMFQFTENTPNIVKLALRDAGFSTRF